MSDARQTEEAELEALFAAVRSRTPAPSAEFLAHLVATAEEMQPAVPAAARVLPAERIRRGWFAVLGGWPALGGLVAATVTGIWVGMAPPEGLTTLAAEMSGQVADVGIYGEEDLLALLEG